MPFDIIGWTGPGMRHVMGFGDGPRKGVLLGANLGRAIVTSGDLLSLRRGEITLDRLVIILFITAYDDDAIICIAKVWATSRSL